jgi:uncharacterized protein (TIGR03435 family)
MTNIRFHESGGRNVGLPVRPIFACLVLAAASGSLSAQTATFDVASVKRNPDGPGPHTRMKDSKGRIDYIAVPLKWLVRQAYRVQDSQISGPDWLDFETYDIAATYSPTATSQERSEMMQHLLAERFKLAVHHQTRDAPAYWLEVAKSGAKLHPVDASPGGFQTSNDGPLRHFHSQTSAAALAVFLSDQLHVRVIDHTELKGTFDMALDWTAADPQQFETALRAAVDAQLGLQLEPKKTPTDIVVIDHAEKIPTEN